MALDYNPQDAVQVWDAGEYDATLIKVESGTSKSSGNPMDTLHFRVFNEDGQEKTIKEYVVVPSTLFKLKQFAIALGKRKDFDAGTFQADDYINTSLRVKLKIDVQEGFDDKNVIASFVAPTATTTPTPAPTTPVAVRRAAPSSAPALARRPLAAGVARSEQPPFSEEPQFKDADIPF